MGGGGCHSTYWLKIERYTANRVEVGGGVSIYILAGDYQLLELSFICHDYRICPPPIYTILHILNSESITSIHSNHSNDCRNTINSILSFIYNS